MAHPLYVSLLVECYCLLEQLVQIGIERRTLTDDGAGDLSFGIDDDLGGVTGDTEDLGHVFIVFLVIDMEPGQLIVLHSLLPLLLCIVAVDA